MAARLRPMRRKKQAPPGTKLRAHRPNAGIEAKYARRLDGLIRDMHDSVDYWLTATYKNNEPHMAMDETPADVLRRAMRRLSRQWLRNFKLGSEDLAKYFAKSVNQRSDAQLKAILRKSGFAVKFTMTKEMRDVMDATVGEQVGLIKSIPQQYLTQVEGLVMRSVAKGGDLQQLKKDLLKRYNITAKRAGLIARDQNNKATTMMHRARCQELELFEQEWMHSHAGKEPRPKHVAADGKRYDVRKGLKVGDKGQWVHPGEEINCRCVGRVIIPGMS